MVARAEMLRNVVDAVLSLDEPNRSTVLLRFYEDLPPREIAARQEVGVETVRGRLKRAVKQLRAKLDRWHPEGRAGWAPLLAGLCGLEVPAELLAAGSGSATTTAAAAETTTTTATAMPMLAGAFSVAAAFLVGAGLAGALTWQTVGRTTDDPPAIQAGSLPGGLGLGGADAHGRGEGSEGRPAVLRGRIPTAEALSALEAENEALRARARALEQERSTLAPARNPHAFRFALPENAPTFDGAAWAELAGHVLAMKDLMAALKAAVEAGEKLPPPILRELRAHNTPLAHLAVRLGPELETDNPNQAYTHPAVVANLVRAALILQGEPLSREQEISLSALGEAWALELERVRSKYTEATPKLARLVAEAEAKLRFLAALKGSLSYPQHDALYRPETEGIVQLDLLAPGWDFMLRHMVKATDVPVLELRLLSTLLDLAGIEMDDDDLTEHGWIGREWVASIPHGAEERTWQDPSLSFPTVEAVLTMAHAQVDAIEHLVAVAGFDAEETARLRDVATLLVPFLYVGEPEAPEAPEAPKEPEDAASD